MKYIESDLLVFAKDLLLTLKLPRSKCVDIVLQKGFLWTTLEINRIRQDFWHKISKNRVLASPMVVKNKYEENLRVKYSKIGPKNKSLFDWYKKKKRLSKRNAIDDIFFLIEYWDISDIKIFCTTACRIPCLDYKNIDAEVQTESNTNYLSDSISVCNSYSEYPSSRTSFSGTATGYSGYSGQLHSGSAVFSQSFWSKLPLHDLCEEQPEQEDSQEINNDDDNNDIEYLEVQSVQLPSSPKPEKRQRSKSAQANSNSKKWHKKYSYKTVMLSCKNIENYQLENKFTSTGLFWIDVRSKNRSKKYVSKNRSKMGQKMGQNMGQNMVHKNPGPPCIGIQCSTADLEPMGTISTNDTDTQTELIDYNKANHIQCQTDIKIKDGTFGNHFKIAEINNFEANFEKTQSCSSKSSANVDISVEIPTYDQSSQTEFKNFQKNFNQESQCQTDIYEFLAKQIQTEGILVRDGSTDTRDLWAQDMPQVCRNGHDEVTGSAARPEHRYPPETSSDDQSDSTTINEGTRNTSEIINLRSPIHIELNKCRVNQKHNHHNLVQNSQEISKKVCSQMRLLHLHNSLPSVEVTQEMSGMGGESSSLVSEIKIGEVSRKKIEVQGNRAENF